MNILMDLICDLLLRVPFRWVELLFLRPTDNHCPRKCRVANEAVAVAAAAATVAATVAVAPAAEALDSCRAWLQRLQHYWHSAAKIVADVAGGAADLSADCGP